MNRSLLLIFTALLLTCCSEAEDSTTPSSSLHFTDVTKESGLHMTLTAGENPPTMLIEVKGTGIALIDFDNDGDQDVFVPNGATIGSPDKGPGCRLFENVGGLRFEDATEKAGLTFCRWSYGASTADVDNDGFDDIFVTCYGKNALLRNTGKGGFEDVSDRSGLDGEKWSSGSAFGDIDGDGDLDLYVCNYAELDARGAPPQATFMGVKVLAGPMGLPKVADSLYENQGNGAFKEISESSGIRSSPAAWALGAVMVDFDGDHLVDIYVGNDSEGSYLFRNLGKGKFEEIGLLSGAALNADGAGQATMGIAVGDVDGNGLPDLFTTNFMYDTNTLHVNLGGMTFEDRTKSYGLQLDSRHFLSWATCFFDFDHDTDEDLIFFNGHIYPEDICAERDWGYDQTAVLYERDGARFERLDPSTAGKWLGEKHCDRSCAFGDLDGDGDIDMVVCGRNQPVRVLRNDRDGGSWLIVRLNDGRDGHDHTGFGSKVTLRAGDSVQHRWIVSGVSFLAGSQPVAHFGLPAGADSATLEVTWSDGHQQAVEDVPANTLHVVNRQ